MAPVHIFTVFDWSSRSRLVHSLSLSLPALDPPHTDPGSTTHRPWIHHTQTLDPPHTDPGSTTHRPWIHRTQTLDPPHTDPGSTTHRPWNLRLHLENTKDAEHAPANRIRVDECDDTRCAESISEGLRLLAQRTQEEGGRCSGSRVQVRPRDGGSRGIGSSLEERCTNGAELENGRTRFQL